MVLNGLVTEQKKSTGNIFKYLVINQHNSQFPNDDLHSQMMKYLLILHNKLIKNYL